MFSPDEAHDPAALPVAQPAQERPPEGEWGWLVTADGRVVLATVAPASAEERAA